MEILFEVPTVGITPKGELLRRAGSLESELDAGKIRLFTDAMPAFDNTVTVADLDAKQATFGGYTAGGITIPSPEEPYWDGAEECYFVVVPAVQFNASGVGDPQTIAGFYVVPDGTEPRIVVRFEEPIIMATVDDAIPITLKFKFA